MSFEVTEPRHLEEAEVVTRFPVEEPAEGSRTHSSVSLCTLRCGHVNERSDVYVYGQGWKVDLLIAVSKFNKCHFLFNKFHHLNIFNFC